MAPGAGDHGDPRGGLPGGPRGGLRGDLRLLLPALAAWGGALAGIGLTWWGALAGAAGIGLLLARRGSRWGLLLLGVATVVGLAAQLRVAGHTHSLVAEAARQHAVVTLDVTLTADPVARDGRFDAYVVARGTASRMTRSGTTHRVAAPVLLLGNGSWERFTLGSRIRVTGRLAAADSSDLAGTLTTVRAPTLLTAPGGLLRGAAAVRAGIRAAASGASPSARELVPGLVVGDDGGLPEQTVDDFRVAGLTHLTAVSGTNLTLVVGCLLLLGRWVGLRGRGLVLLGLVGVVSFVVLARPEPSVVRAAAMGSVALLGWGSAGGGSGSAGRGIRTLSAGVLVLLLVDPWLAVSIGFALSAAATAGILLLGPPLRDGLARWMPGWAAEALAVPFAAQVACTPLVAVVSGQVSVVAVVANLLVAPVVGPATVLGLAGGVVEVVWPWGGQVLGHLLGRGAGLCADWIVLVAHRSAALPGAGIGWPRGRVGIGLLTLLCVVVAWGAPAFARSRARTLCVVGVMLLGLFRPLPAFGWPPAGWVLVACSVGQGDGLVLRTGPHAGVVVDTGPEPGLMDRCLRRLGIRQVPVVVLTHFHADHIGGLAGVLRGRSVGEIDVTSFREPEPAARDVDELAGDVPVRVPALGEVRNAGEVTWQVLGPVRPPTSVDPDAGPNNASLMLLVQVRGVRILLTGDAEPEEQRAVERAVHDLRVDVLKVPHHGSGNQDAGFLGGLSARLAVISVGKDNAYGHPSAKTLDLLRGAGMTVGRTDLRGDVAVVVRDGAIRLAAYGRTAGINPGGAG